MSSLPDAWERELMDDKQASRNGHMDMLRRAAAGGDAARSSLEKLTPILALGGKNSPRLQKAMTYVAAAQLTFDYASKAYQIWQHRNRETPQDEYTIFMDEDNTIASAIMLHISKMSTTGNEQILYLESNQRWARMPAPGEEVDPDDRDVDLDDPDVVLTTDITLRPDEEIRPIEFEIDGYTVAVSRSTGKPGQSKPDNDQPIETMALMGGYSSRDWDRYLVLTVVGDDALEALKTWLKSLIKPTPRRNVVPRSTLYTYGGGSSGSWNARRTSEQRSMDSVTLREGQTEAIVEDVKTFLAMEQDYVDYGLRYRRGYLLYGPPGCGKTSFVTALARFLGIDVYYMNLQSMKSNEDLTRALDYVEAKSFVVFEDVDVVVPRRDGGKVRDGVTLDHLLNVVDGMLTPHGSIFVMTTNERETLDEALVRPGRIDMEVLLSYLDDHQTKKMVAHYVGRELELPSIADKQIVPAALADVFKRHLFEREGAISEIYDLLKS